MCSLWQKIKLRIYFCLQAEFILCRDCVQKSKFNFLQAYIKPTKPFQGKQTYQSFPICGWQTISGSEINMVDHEDIFKTKIK